MYLKTTAEQKADLHVHEELQPGYCLYSVYYEVFMHTFFLCFYSKHLELST